MRTEILVYNAAGIVRRILLCADPNVAARAIIKLEKLGFSWRGESTL